MKPIKTPCKILVRATNWVGDAIMMTPALRAVRKAFPKTQITLLAKPWVLPVFQHSADLDAPYPAFAIELYTQGLGWELLAGNMGQEFASVNKDGVAANGLNNCDAGFAQFAAKVFNLANAIIEVILFNDLLKANGNGF